MPWTLGWGQGRGKPDPDLRRKTIFSEQPCLGTELHPFSYTGEAALQPQGLPAAHQLPQGVSVHAPHGDVHNRDLPPQGGHQRPGVPTHRQQRELEALYQGLPRWAGPCLGGGANAGAGLQADFELEKPEREEIKIVGLSGVCCWIEGMRPETPAPASVLTPGQVMVERSSWAVQGRAWDKKAAALYLWTLVKSLPLSRAH